MRSKKSYKLEQLSLSWDTAGLVAGVDEAGRGPLAGPVVAAAVILDQRQPIKGLADSKKLTALRREKLFDEIRAKALCCSIAQASVEEIDRLNILQATLLAMRRAVAKLPRTPDHALVDGNQPPPLACPVRCVVGGDGLSFSIAGASIIAKVLRDRAMRRLDPRWPAYGFARHAGYPTAAHREALARLGPSPHHRRGFGPVDQAVLNLT